MQNKFAVEWKSGPINFFPLNFLRTVFTRLQNRYAIVYSRPRINLDKTQFSQDHNLMCEYPDLAEAANFENVTVLEDLESTGLAYNELKLSILAKSHLFLAVQGGGAHVLPYFGDSVLFVLHISGREYPGAYQRGLYKQLSDSPPQVFVVRDWKNLAAAFPLFESIELSTVGARVHPKAEVLLKEFRM